MGASKFRQPTTTTAATVATAAENIQPTQTTWTTQTDCKEEVIRVSEGNMTYRIFTPHLWIKGLQRNFLFMSNVPQIIDALGFPNIVRHGNKPRTPNWLVCLRQSSSTPESQA